MLQSPRVLSVSRKRLTSVKGYVWCDRHGEIHEDELDPYQYGPPGENEEDARCVPEDHRKVYARHEYHD
jgi:hypothetical protein